VIRPAEDFINFKNGHQARVFYPISKPERWQSATDEATCHPSQRWSTVDSLNPRQLSRTKTVRLVTILAHRRAASACG
jgi:hypothetical protein